MPSTLTFPRKMRLSGRRQFAGAYDGKTRASEGPLLVYSVPNGLGHGRLGLAVSRRVGKNVTRNLIKRRLREAFRLMQRSLPGAYDVVINVRPHDPLELAEYRKAFATAIEKLHATWLKKLEKQKAKPPRL